MTELEQRRILSARQNAFNAYLAEGNEDDARLVLLGEGDHFAAVQAAMSSYDDGHGYGLRVATEAGR